MDALTEDVLWLNASARLRKYISSRPECMLHHEALLTGAHIEINQIVPVKGGHCVVMCIPNILIPTRKGLVAWDALFLVYPDQIQWIN